MIAAASTLARWVAEPPLDPSGEEGRRLLREELAKPGYSTEPSLLDRLMELFDGATQGGGGSAPAWLVPLLVALVVAVLALIAIALVRPDRRTSSGATTGAVIDDHSLSAAAYRERAQRALDQHQWDDAVIDGFRAVVAGATERTLLDDLPGRTAREAATSLGQVFPEHAAMVTYAADCFNEVRYGDTHTDEEHARAVLDCDDRLRAARPQLTSVGGDS